MKITLATVKKFIRESGDNLLIDVRSSFDGMTDCIQLCGGKFVKATREEIRANTLGIKGAWFVGHSDDYFQPYEKENLKGIEVSNCCGSFILAVKK